jgi:hypothetical protein
MDEIIYKRVLNNVIEKKVKNNENRCYIDIEKILEEIDRCYNKMENNKKDKSEKFEDMYLINCEKTKIKKELDFLYLLLEVINENKKN